MARGQGRVRAELQAQRGRRWEPRLAEAGLGMASGRGGGRGLLPLSTGAQRGTFLAHRGAERGVRDCVSCPMTDLAGHPIGISRGCRAGSLLPSTPWHWCQALLKWQGLDIAEEGGASRQATR